MKFGIFYEHQLPRPWDDGDEHRLLKDALDQVELADRLGLRLRLGGRAPLPRGVQPLLRARGVPRRRARSARRASGSATASSPLPVNYNHTARVAERIATLDLVSDGRVEFGTGETSSEAELGGFGIERAEKRDQWDEALDAVTRMMVETPFAGYDGSFLKMPPRNVVPKPLQKPHPPMWVACSRRETIHLAATKGIGALSFSFVESAEAKHWVDDYYSTIASEECVPGGFVVNPNIACVLPMMVHHDEETAIERGLDGGHFFGYSLGHYYVYGDHTPGRDQRVGAVREEPLAVRLRPAGRRADGRHHRRPDVAGRPGRAPRRGRHAGPGARPDPRVRRTRASTSSSSSARRAATATRTSASRSSCSPPRSCPSSTRARRSGRSASSSGSPRRSTPRWPAGRRPQAPPRTTTSRR